MNRRIPIPGHFLTANGATERSIAAVADVKIRAYAPNFKPIDLTSDEYRALTALWGLYDEHGYTQATFDTGISLTPYELCKRMWYVPDGQGRFGMKAVNASRRALLSLAEKKSTIYFTRFKRKQQGKNLYDAVVVPNCPLIQIVYELSDVTKVELESGQLIPNKTRIHVRIQPFFYCNNYFKLFEAQFYPRLKAILKKSDRRVSKFHWRFALWRLQQGSHRKSAEISVDKLALTLKLPSDLAHRTRTRNIVRQLYEDFRKFGDISSYQIDVAAKSGGTKDVLMFAGQLG